MTANGPSITPRAHSTAWPGAPGLRAALRHGKALRQAGRQLLKDIGNVKIRLNAAADLLAEVVLDLVLDDKNDLVEPGKARVIQRILDDAVARGSMGVICFRPPNRRHARAITTSVGFFMEILPFYCVISVFCAASAAGQAAEQPAQCALL